MIKIWPMKCRYKTGIQGSAQTYTQNNPEPSFIVIVSHILILVSFSINFFGIKFDSVTQNKFRTGNIWFIWQVLCNKQCQTATSPFLYSFILREISKVTALPNIMTSNDFSSFRHPNNLTSFLSYVENMHSYRLLTPSNL